MRETCLLCVRKHLGQAEALMTEVRQGYPQHAGLAIGHLAEAAAEAMQEHPQLAAEIREHWKAFEVDEDAYEVPTVSLLKKVEELLQETRKKQEAEHKSHPQAEEVKPGDGSTSFKPEGDQIGEGAGAGISKARLPQTSPGKVAADLGAMAKGGSIRKSTGDLSKIDMADVTGEVGTGKRGHA